MSLLPLLALLAAADGVHEEILSAAFCLTGDGSNGTGFLVRDGDRVLVVTAAHVWETTKGEESRIVLRTPEARRELPLTIRRDGKPLWTRHKDHDLAALPLKLPEGVVAQPFALEELGAARVGQEVWIPCFPAGLEANKAGWPVLRRGTIATFPTTPASAAPTILVDFSTFGGDSGAPVVAVHEGRRVLLSVVLGMHRQTDRTTTPFEERTTHMPMGLSYTLQAAFVRELLDTMRR